MYLKHIIAALALGLTLAGGIAGMAPAHASPACAASRSPPAEHAHRLF